MRTDKQRDIICRLAEIDARLCQRAESGVTVDFCGAVLEDGYNSGYLSVMVSNAYAVVAMPGIDHNGEHYLEWGLESRFPHAHAFMDYNDSRRIDSFMLAREFAEAFGLEFRLKGCVCYHCVRDRVMGEVK